MSSDKPPKFDSPWSFIDENGGQLQRGLTRYLAIALWADQRMFDLRYHLTVRGISILKSNLRENCFKFVNGWCLSKKQVGFVSLTLLCNQVLWNVWSWNRLWLELQGTIYQLTHRMWRETFVTAIQEGPYMPLNTQISTSFFQPTPSIRNSEAFGERWE